MRRPVSWRPRARRTDVTSFVARRAPRLRPSRRRVRCPCLRRPPCCTRIESRRSMAGAESVPSSAWYQNAPVTSARCAGSRGPGGGGLCDAFRRHSRTNADRRLDRRRDVPVRVGARKGVLAGDLPLISTDASTQECCRGAQRGTRCGRRTETAQARCRNVAGQADVERELPRVQLVCAAEQTTTAGSSRIQSSLEAWWTASWLCSAKLACRRDRAGIQ